MPLLAKLVQAARKIFPFTKYDGSAHLKLIDGKLDNILSILQKPVLGPAALECARPATPEGARSSAAALLGTHITGRPGEVPPFDIFAGEWSSLVPGYGGGIATLFDDHRIHWLGEQVGGFGGKRILDLGPLEGGHTCMMATHGAESVTAIEGNVSAFLKCLIVQNALGFKANFQLGDFAEYLAETSDTYDLVVASGVLYHMIDPVQIIKDMAKISGQIFIWTHYYDAEIINSRPELKAKFSETPRVIIEETKTLRTFQQNYLQALEWGGFCGGPESASFWLDRDSLLGLLGELGYSVRIFDEQRLHPNGPALSLFASRG
jgi:hypothetical protein